MTGSLFTSVMGWITTSISSAITFFTTFFVGQFLSLFLAMFIVYLVGRSLLIPIIGGQATAGSDKAGKHASKHGKLVSTQGKRVAN